MSFFYFSSGVDLSFDIYPLSKMVLRTLSPAEQFRDELGQRLAYDAQLSLPSANMLVGVIIDAMEYLVSAESLSC